MSRFVVTLPAAHRVMLEHYRKATGLRSEAEALRHLIDTYAPMPLIKTLSQFDRETSRRMAALDRDMKAMADQAFGPRDAQAEKLEIMAGSRSFQGVTASGEALEKPKPGSRLKVKKP